jgi:hypothetical protein
MNWTSKQKRTKQVQLSFEWTDKTDLRLILDDVRALILSGVESYHEQKKSLEIADKWHNVEFQQSYIEKIHEQVESDINGELKLVIKSRF